MGFSPRTAAVLVLLSLTALPAAAASDNYERERLRVDAARARVAREAAAKQAPACQIKPVMTDEEIDRCRKPKS